MTSSDCRSLDLFDIVIVASSLGSSLSKTVNKIIGDVVGIYSDFYLGGVQLGVFTNSFT